MSAMQPFNPRWGSNQIVSPAAGSASITVGGQTKQIHIENTGTNPMSIRTGNSANGTVTATTADFRISPGTVEVITKPQDDDKVAYISASGTTAEIIEGEGW